jgi:hypothetical protein
MRKSQLARTSTTMGPLSFKPKPPSLVNTNNGVIVNSSSNFPNYYNNNNNHQIKIAPSLLTTTTTNSSTTTTATIIELPPTLTITQPTTLQSSSSSQNSQSPPPPIGEIDTNINSTTTTTQQPPSYQYSTELPNKIITPQAYDAVVGQLRVMQSRISQLEEEVFLTKAEVVIREAEFKSNKSKTEQDRLIEDLETRLGFQDRELKEAEERRLKHERLANELENKLQRGEYELKNLLEMKNKLESTVQVLENQLSSSTTINDNGSIVAGNMDKKQPTMTKSMTHFSSSTTSSSSSDYPLTSSSQQLPSNPPSNQTTTTTTKRQRITAPSNISSANNNPNHIMIQRILREAHSEIFSLLSTPSSLSMSLYSNLTNISVGTQPLSTFISAIMQYLEHWSPPTTTTTTATNNNSNSPSDQSIFNVLRILEICILRSSQFAHEILTHHPTNRDHPIFLHGDRLLTNTTNDLIISAILSLFLTLSRTKGFANPETIQVFHFILEKPVFVNKIHECDDIAGDLLEVLTRKDSTAVPKGWPRDPTTWNQVPTPLWSRKILLTMMTHNSDNINIFLKRCIGRCHGLIEQHGDDGTKFLLHFGGLAQLVDILYYYATCLKIYTVFEELSLLAVMWPAIVSTSALRSLTDEYRHRLLESLLWYRETPSLIMPSREEGCRISRLASQFLRNMGHDRF